MYAKRGDVAACRVVCIGLYLKSVRVYVFYLVLWTTGQSPTALARTRTFGRSTSTTQYRQNDILPHHHA